MKYVCELCGYIYDEAAGDEKRGIPAGTAFADLPADYECPRCGFGLESFDPVQAKPAEARETRQPNYSFWNDAKYSDGKVESER